MQCICSYHNNTFNKLEKNDVKKYVITIILLFSVWPTLIGIAENIMGRSYEGLNTIGLFGDQSGYTIVNFIMCYIIGASIHYCKSYNKNKVLLLFFICYFLNASWSMAGAYLNISVSSEKYCNPLVIGMAVLGFLWFKELKIKNIRWVNELSKGSFSVFLLHMFFIRFLNIKKISSYNFVLMTFAIIVVCIFIYLACMPLSILFELSYTYIENKVLLIYKSRKSKI